MGGVPVNLSGIATSTRGRGEANSFNVIRMEPPEIEVERMSWAPRAGAFYRPRRSATGAPDPGIPHFNDGKGRFGPGAKFQDPQAVPYSMIAADLNRDRRPDIRRSDR